MGVRITRKVTKTSSTVHEFCVSTLHSVHCIGINKRRKCSQWKQHLTYLKFGVRFILIQRQQILFAKHLKHNLKPYGNLEISPKLQWFICSARSNILRILSKFKRKTNWDLPSIQAAKAKTCHTCTKTWKKVEDTLIGSSFIHHIHRQ